VTFVFLSLHSLVATAVKPYVEIYETISKHLRRYSRKILKILKKKIEEDILKIF